MSALTACRWRAAGGGKGGERESRGADEPRPSPPRTVQGPYSAPLLPTLTPLGVLTVLASSLEAGGAMTKVCWSVDCRSVNLDLPPDRPCDRLPTASRVPTASRPTSLLPPPSPRPVPELGRSVSLVCRRCRLTEQARISSSRPHPRPRRQRPPLNTPSQQTTLSRTAPLYRRAILPRPRACWSLQTIG